MVQSSWEEMWNQSLDGYNISPNHVLPLEPLYKNRKLFLSKLDWVEFHLLSELSLLIINLRGLILN